MNNRELFESYSAELALRHSSPKGRREAERILKHLANYLDGYHPTPELATSFLAQYKDRKPTTLARYHAVIQGLMTWMGQPLTSRIKVPQPIPQYIRDEDVEKLREAMRNSRTRKPVERNLLMVDILCDTGLRRAEIANLKVGDIDLESGVLIVREGKGRKDRMVNLTSSLAEKLGPYLEGRDKDQEILEGLTPAAISDIIRRYAKKADVDLHTHSLRDYFATRLVDRQVDLEMVRRLLGHSNLNTTQRYLGRTDEQRREAIARLDEPIPEVLKGRTRRQMLTSDSDETIMVERKKKHHEDMLSLLGRWRDELQPQLWLITVRDLGGVGYHTKGDTGRKVAWEICDNGETLLRCAFEIEDGIREVLLKNSLYCHLESAQKAWLLDSMDAGMPAWRSMGGQEVMLRCQLLNAIDRSCRRLSGKLPSTDLNQAGPTLWFSESIQSIVTDGTSSGFEYNLTEMSDAGLHQVKYGSSIIAFAADRKKANQYVRRHRELIKQYEENDLVWEIGELKGQRDDMVKAILLELEKIIMAEHVPGRCDSCPD